jgi:hypothetical protein
MPEPAVVPRADEGKAPAAAANPQPAPTFPAFEDDPVSRSLEAAKRAEEMARQPQQPQLSPWKADFLRANPKLTRDEEAASLTRGAYLSALRRGIRDDSLEMNEAILSGFDRMREAVSNASHEPAREPPVNAPEPRRSVPMSAPVSRSAPSAAGGAISTRIDLSPEERDMARRSYQDLPPEKAERLYAEMKGRMLAARRNGTLNE